MKTVGLMGGSNYESTTSYLRAINIELQRVLGTDRSCKSMTCNLDHKDLIGDKASYSREIIYHSSLLREAGVHFLVLCDVRLHDVAKDIRRNLNLPIVHIGESLGKALQADNINKVLIVGKRDMMQSDFYVNALNRYGINVVVPPTKVINEIHEWIENEQKESIQLIGIIESFRIKGVAAVVFTEFLDIPPENLSMRVYDSFTIHVQDIVKEIIKGIG